MRAASPLLIVLASVIGMAGCGDGGEPDQAPPSSPEAASAVEIDIADFKYVPDAATVVSGAEVTFTNSDRAPHTATADDGSFDTKTLQRDDTARIVLDEPGTYTYYCRFHAFMKASIEVN